jgi:hypothetical protein
MLSKCCYDPRVGLLVCWVNFRSVLVLQNLTFKGMAEMKMLIKMCLKLENKEHSPHET